MGSTHQLGGDHILLLVVGDLVVGGEDHAIGQQRQSQGGIADLPHFPILLDVQGLVIGHLHLGGSCSTGDGRAKLTQLPVLEVLFLIMFYNHIMI